MSSKPLLTDHSFPSISHSKCSIETELEAGFLCLLTSVSACVCVCVHNRRLCEEESRQLEKTGRMHCTSSLCLFRLQEQLAIVNEIQPWRRNLIDSPRELHRRGLPFPLMPSLVVVVHSKCVCSFSVTPFEVHSSGYVAETALDHHSATH